MAEIIRPDRSIPQSAAERALNLEREASQSFNIRRFSDAIRLYRQELQELRDSERQHGRPIHKGTPLHMIGLCYAVTNQHDYALRYFALAYIEDTLNANYGEEDEADRAPAARMLRDFYGIRMEFLRQIKEIVNQAKRAGEWARLSRPETILQRVRRATEIDTNRLNLQLIRPAPRVARRQPFGFPQPWEQRVFIGGNYQTHMPIIRHVETIVNNLGYTPIVAFDVDIPRDNTHNHTMLLLHTCGHAIFEVSNASGQLMEIERTYDYRNRVLLLYSRMYPEAEPSASVTTMLQTSGFRLTGYAALPDIDPIVREFLTRPPA